MVARSPAAPQAVPSGIATQRASACLGGATDLTSAMQYAQASAPLTGTGAAEFVATYVRWWNSGPTPTQAEHRTLLPALVTPEALPAVSALLRPPPTDPPPTTSASAVGGYYRIDEATATRAQVSVVIPAQASPPGGPSSELTLWGSYTVAAVNGVWRLAGVPVATDRATVETQGQMFGGTC
jgi:hypothetical protein